MRKERKRRSDGRWQCYISSSDIPPGNTRIKETEDSRRSVSTQQQKEHSTPTGQTASTESAIHPDKPLAWLLIEESDAGDSYMRMGILTSLAFHRNQRPYLPANDKYLGSPRPTSRTGWIELDRIGLEVHPGSQAADLPGLQVKSTQTISRPNQTPSPSAKRKAK